MWSQSFQSNALPCFHLHTSELFLPPDLCRPSQPQGPSHMCPFGGLSGCPLSSFAGLSLCGLWLLSCQAFVYFPNLFSMCLSVMFVCVSVCICYSCLSLACVFARLCLWSVLVYVCLSVSICVCVCLCLCVPGLFLSLFVRMRVCVCVYM